MQLVTHTPLNIHPNKLPRDYYSHSYSSISSSSSTSKGSGTSASSPSSSSSTAVNTPAAALAPAAFSNPTSSPNLTPRASPPGVCGAAPPPRVAPGAGVGGVVFFFALSSSRDLGSSGVVSKSRIGPPVGCLTMSVCWFDDLEVRKMAYLLDRLIPPFSRERDVFDLRRKDTRHVLQVHANLLALDLLLRCGG